jgi:hypothetical protein
MASLISMSNCSSFVGPAGAAGAGSSFLAFIVCLYNREQHKTNDD